MKIKKMKIKKMKIKLNEINNHALRCMIENGELDMTRIFKHRYSGGQVDWGYIDTNGDRYAWFGGDHEEVVDSIDIIKEYPLDYVEGFVDLVFKSEIPYMSAGEVAEHLNLTRCRINQIVKDIDGSFKNLSGWQIPSKWVDLEIKRREK